MSKPSRPRTTVESLVLVTDATRAGLGGRKDFVGLRRDGDVDGLIFTCACGCGGHVVVDRVKMEKLEAYRTVWAARAVAHGHLPAFGGGVYVKGHEPLGIAGESIRTGVRTQLRATA